MTERTMKAILAVAESRGFEMEGHDNYSGRGMYGQTTCAVSYADEGELLVCVAQAAFRYGGARDSAAFCELTRDLEGLRHDQLGRGMIAY